MNKLQIEAYLADLNPIVFCKFCDQNIKRQEIGHHYRTKSHIENLERCRAEGTYEDLIEYHELYIVVHLFIFNEKERKKRNA